MLSPTYFRHFASCALLARWCELGEGKPYREKEINNVHQDQDQVTNSGHVVAVAGGDQGAGDDVVREHLPVILAALLNVDDDDLLQPERPLRQNVELVQAGQLTLGPVRPELLQVQPVRRRLVDVLCNVSLRCATMPLGPLTMPRGQKTR